MKTNELLLGAAAFAGGILVGKNWNKIKELVVLSATKIKRKTQSIYEESAKDNKPAKNKAVFIFCPQCKTKLKSTTKFCHKCGKKTRFTKK